MSESFFSKKGETPTKDFYGIHQDEKQALGIFDTKYSIGLALSGGGIRSASFGLGVIQALLEHGIMQKVDYLSTVSGGGYIGSSLTWYRYLHSDPNDFFDESNPFGQKGKGVRSSVKFDGNNTFLSYIRQHGNYLCPSRLLNFASVIGVALRNLIISFMIYFSLLVFVISLSMLAANIIVKIIPPIFKLNDVAIWMHSPFFQTNLIVASIILLLSILFGLIFSISTFRNSLGNVERRYSSYNIRNLYQWISGILLCGFIVFLLLALVPMFEDLFTDWRKTVGVGIVGGISGLWAALSKFRKFLGGESLFKKASWIGDRLFEIGALIFLFAMLVFSYNLCIKLGIPSEVKDSLEPHAMIFPALIAIVALSFGWFVNINYASLGRMYRDRLMEAFLPDDKSVKRNKWTYAWKADVALLEDMCKENDSEIRKPFHLINSNIILTNSKEEKFRNRGGDSFILSPLFCGSDATGYVKTNCFMKNKNQNKGSMTLATAMAISGAAANPHTGIAGKGPTRGPLVSMLMTIFNLRLGSWICNPKDGAKPRTMNYLRPGLCSLCHFGYDENQHYLELTDGGHFENLGLYELVKRRVGTIIVSDAGVDKGFKFGDLANAIEKVRTDFGVSIRFEPEDDSQLNTLIPGSAANGKFKDLYELAEKGYVTGKIKYPKKKYKDREKNNITLPKFDGNIFLIKTTMTKNLPVDLYSYKAQHKDFPDQPTSDQFFDEKQFEAYRELGYRLADSMCPEFNKFKKTRFPGCPSILHRRIK